jgi:PAB-dependent poly(A)-specific ribonuclease subunit 2
MQFLFTEKGVLSISRHSVHYAHRRGITVWHSANAEFTDLKCMNFTSKGTREIVVAGCQGSMFKVDVEKGTVTDSVCVQHVTTLPC